LTIKYVFDRTIQLVLVIFIAMTVNFILPRVIPGDPVEAFLRSKMATSGGTVTFDIAKVGEEYRRKFGFDKPIWLQYANYWNDVIHLELGVSLIHFPSKVSDQILNALPWTMGLLTASVIIAFVAGSVAGALLAWPQTPTWFTAALSPVMLLSTVPAFLLAIIMLWVFAADLRWFPGGGGFSSTHILRWNLASVRNIMYHAILPAGALVLSSLGGWALGMRALAISVLGEDYIMFAEAKGLPSRRIFLWYGMRNAMLPQVTALALTLGSVISGTVLVEAMFGYPGIGSLLFNAIATKDYFVIQGIVLMLILSLGSALFVIDMVYPLLDPRIRYN